jgi:hypothetical protein
VFGVGDHQSIPIRYVDLTPRLTCLTCKFSTICRIWNALHTVYESDTKLVNKDVNFTFML